jgi:hypothetical protein
LADSPEAYWRFDETSGTTFADATGNGFTGTLGPAVTLGNPGALASDPTDTSVLFGPSTKIHASVNDASKMNTSGGVTLEAWIDPITFTGGSAGSDVLVVGLPSNIGRYALEASTVAGSAGQVNINTGAVGGGLVTVSSAVGAAPSGMWTYIVGTYDGTTLSLYVNGSLANSQVMTGSLGVPITFAFMGGQLYQGGLDEAAVYGYALTASQVQAHYNAAVNLTALRRP